MIIAHKDLIKGIETGCIHCKPFDPVMVGVNSIDVHLGDKIKIILPNWNTGINPKIEQLFHEQEIGQGFWVQPGMLVLAHTEEEIGSDFYVPMYSGRSSVARCGLFTEVSAGFGEIGFKRQWTLELIAPAHPVLIWPGMRIGQVFFETASDVSVLYGRDIKAHYATQEGPQESKFHE